MFGWLLIFALLYLAAVPSTVAKDDRKTGLYDTATCNNECKGLHDINCQALSNGQAACKCQAGYYSVYRQCEVECEDKQFWSLFTYGSCADVTPSREFERNVGLCNKMCVFRVRVWATVFMIILFASAILLLFLMLPGCITSCYTCIFLRKQKRRAEEDAAAAGGQMDPQGMMKAGGGPSMGGPMGGGYNYPGYGWPYYAQGRV